MSVKKKSSVSALVVLLILMGLFAYAYGIRGMRFFLVPSRSMLPTLHVGDYLVVFPQKAYHRGDIVVLDDPTEKGAFLVKRIVAMPGEFIRIQNGAIYINGSYASEPYVSEPVSENLVPGYQCGPGEIFLLGDNRNDSEDCLTWKRGVPLKSVVGRVRFIYAPVSRMGVVHSYPLRTVREIEAETGTEEPIP